MISLAQYFFVKIHADYQEWRDNNNGDGVPGRLILREFDPDLVDAIVNIIEQSKLPMATLGSESGFITVVEDHEHYQGLEVKKHSFADLTHERNREGNFFCLMFIAETKPTHDQVSRIDQNLVFEPSETQLWVDIAKRRQNNTLGFNKDYVKELAKFITELTHPNWNNRSFIGIDRINQFIDHVVSDTIKNGLFWDALGKNCIYLGGINRLDEFRPLKDADKNYRKVFRKLISNTLFSDIDFWRAIVRDKEVSENEIEDNLKKLEEESSDHAEFCALVKEYFSNFFSNPESAKDIQVRIQKEYDSHSPFASVLQQKKNNNKLKLGEDTAQFMADNDIDVSQSNAEMLYRVDTKIDKPDINELRGFYFNHTKELAEDSRLEKAWLKEISSGKPIECYDFIEGVLSVLSKSVLMTGAGTDTITLTLAKDRTKKSLLKKNKDALVFFFNEYRDLSQFWSLFGDNFNIEFPKAFDLDELIASKDLKSKRISKATNQLHFRVLRHNGDIKNPLASWELVWNFDHNGFECAKYVDFHKVLSRKGYYYLSSLSIDSLYVKNSDTTPTINNKQMFYSISSRMNPGEIIRKTDQESADFSDLVTQLHKSGYFDDTQYAHFNHLYQNYIESWRNAISSILESPLLSELNVLESAYNDVISFFDEEKQGDATFRQLLYKFITAHTLSVRDNASYAVYLPWSPYSLIMESRKRKIFRDLANNFRNNRLLIGNQNESVFSRLIKELNESFGKSLFLLKNNDLPGEKFEGLICTQSRFGYYEYTSLSDSQNSLNTKEIRSVIKATTQKFLETYPNERHHLQILCNGLISYEHILSVYDELLTLSELQEDPISIVVIFTCNNRHPLDVIYQSICESFDASKIDSSIKVRVISSLDEVNDGDVDLLFSFDPLYTTNDVSNDERSIIITENNDSFWEYCASRKIPSNRILEKSSFALNNHVFDPISARFHNAFMASARRPIDNAYCREVAQRELGKEINKGLTKSNWLIIYDYLLSKDTLNLSENKSGNTNDENRRVLRYVQGEGVKRSLAVVTEKETHHITSNLDANLRKWRFVHPNDTSKLVDTIFSLSNAFSGDALLKSVGNGNHSHDLVGTAGSTVLVEALLSDSYRIGEIFWIHLDDYVGWFKSSIEDDAMRSLGNTQNYVSDLMGMYLSKESDGKISVNIVVCESKLTNGNSSEQAVKSCKQLKATCNLIESMLKTSLAFDFRYWLNKFLDFFLNNFEFPPKIFDFDELLSLDKKSVTINLYGLSVLMHYDNEIIKSECVTIYEEEADHLLQISLNAKETKNIFKHMIDDSQSLQLETPIQLVPLELNQPLTDEELNAIQSVPDINSTDNQTVPSAHEPEDTDLKITAKPSIPEEALNVTQAFESDITPAKISEQDKSVMGLVRKCVNFLDQNVTQGASNSIDIDRVKAGVRQILSHSNLPSNFVETITTPNSIVVKLQGDIQLSANKINNMRDHFLSVVGLSLRQVYPEPGVMVLVFDRDQRETVHYLELIKRTLSQREATLNQGFNNRILIGQLEFSDGSCFYRLDGPSPHALIGGQTKSGKSILMNNMITDLIMTNTPDNLKLRLFDPKQVEFVSYSQSAHLAHPVVLDKDEAVIRLTELENLMNQRYVRLKDLGLKNIESFNQKYPAEPMSREVVFFDELADWILDSEFKKSANNIISRLSSKGRAAGIHLVLATQRPSNDVVSTILRANLDTKIALKVDRDLNSEIILGESGAENLLGYGHGIVKTEGDTMSVQVGFTDQEVFDQLVEIIIQYWNA